jgi:hypothetical protein
LSEKLEELSEEESNFRSSLGFGKELSDVLVRERRRADLRGLDDSIDSEEEVTAIDIESLSSCLELLNSGKFLMGVMDFFSFIISFSILYID